MKYLSCVLAVFLLASVNAKADVYEAVNSNTIVYDTTTATIVGITPAGQNVIALPQVSGGNTFTIASGCTATSLTGGQTAGSFVASGTSCSPVITLPAAPHGWFCDAKDVTNTQNFYQSATSTTSCTIAPTTGSVTASDKIIFTATGY